MKITGSICLHYYKETNQSNSRTRYKNSSLSLVKSPTDKNDVFLIYQTAQNNGQKYKIMDNIGSVFTKYVVEGKSTIRLKVPAIDICIQGCESIQLKCFLQSLKLVLLKEFKSLQLSTVSSSNTVSQMSKKLFIKGSDKYNALHTLPRTLQTVKMNSVSLTRIDLRILKLQNLRVLDLACNKIETLPDDVGKLPIAELYLGNNRLGTYPHSSYWKWMSGHTIQKTLKLLNLENNELPCLPYYIVRLKYLVTLRVNNNLITELPTCIGHLPRLSYLLLCNNRLKWIPSTMCSLSLVQLDIGYNDFEEVSSGLYKCDDYSKTHFSNIVPTLLETSALKVVNHRIRYQEDDIPISLQDYLSDFSQCVCQRSTVHKSPVGYRIFKARFSSMNMVNSNSCPPIYKVNYCSYMCYTKRPA